MSRFRSNFDRRNSSVDSMSGRAAIRRAKTSPRQDVKPSMLKLCPIGWDFDEDFANQVAATNGYYMVPEYSIVHNITPEMAEELFTYHNYEYQRRFDQGHAERLSSEITVMVAIDIAVGPSCYPEIVNGQHTLWAAYMSGKHMQARVTVYMCRDVKAVTDLFSIFDSNKVRSASTILETKVNAGVLNITYPASRHHRWAQCVACAEAGFQQPKARCTNAEKADRAQRPEVIEFAKWIEKHLVDRTNSSKMITMGIGACLYSMRHADPEKADQFIKMYLSGTNLSENHPVLVLRERMTIDKPEAEHGANATRLHTEIAFTCWGKFCRDELLYSTRRTKNLPRWDKWKIYTTPRDQNEVVAPENEFSDINSLA